MSFQEQLSYKPKFSRGLIVKDPMFFYIIFIKNGKILYSVLYIFSMDIIFLLCIRTVFDFKMITIISFLRDMLNNLKQLFFER